MEKNQAAAAHDEYSKKKHDDKGGGGGDGENANDKAAHQENKQDQDRGTVQGGGDGAEINASLFDDIDCFLAILLSIKDGCLQGPPPQLPASAIDKLLSIVDDDISICESAGSDKWPIGLLPAIDRVARLSTYLPPFSSSNPDYKQAANRASAALQRAMSFLEEEFRLLLEHSNTNAAPVSRSCKPSPRRRDSDLGGASSPAAKNSDEAVDDTPPYPPETIDKLRRISNVMISAGYQSECFQAFSISRGNAFDADLSSLGFRKMSVDDVQKMPWESLQAEILTWIKAFRTSVSVYFPRERDLLEFVFAEYREVAGSLLNNLTRGVLIRLLNFTEAITLTKVSAEKLFKFLDVYEALRDMLPKMDVLFPGKDEAADIKSEISSARARLGEAAAATFGDLEGSVKADAAKTPVVGGAIHPLTRYVMNYLKYASDYRRTLEQVFDESQGDGEPSSQEHSALATQFISVMDLLDLNLEAKSKLYKELALGYIFLMNNGRYINKKIKESAEIYELVGEKWHRKRSAELRQHHKNYQRESWSKVLGCFKDEGTQVKGSVSKSALKERMKSFNAMFEEILKTQSTWVVCDEQLKSELQVSVAAVLVPAYRSFLVRYRQHVSGRQAEKHIKFAPEDIEGKIDELFEGSTSSHGRKR